MFTYLIVLISLLYLSLITSLIWSRIWVFIKAGLILATLIITGFTVWAIQDALGTPTAKQLPKEFLLSSTLIREPNKNKSDPGAIYYVVIENQGGVAVPRVYQKPYTNKRHAQTSKLQSAIDKSKGPVWVQNQDGEEMSSGEEGEKGGQGVGKKMAKALKKAARGFGFYDDDSESNLKLDNVDPLPSKE